MDRRANATTGAGITKKEALPTVYQLLIGAASLLEVCIKTDFDFDILPANRELAGAEVGDELGSANSLNGCCNKNHRRIRLRPIDCPPALNMLTVNALSPPFRYDPDAVRVLPLEGLSDLVETLRKVRPT